MQSFRWDHSRQVLNLNQPPVCCDLRSQSESVLECFVKSRFGPGHKREQETVSLVLLGRRFVGASFGGQSRFEGEPRNESDGFSFFKSWLFLIMGRVKR